MEILGGILMTIEVSAIVYLVIYNLYIKGDR